jgi:hypothetical protein
MLEKYQFLSTDWLLFGKGSMYADSKMHTLFDYNLTENRENTVVRTKDEEIRHETDSQDDLKRRADNSSVHPEDNPTSEVVKIVWFFGDNSFEEFEPRK